MDKQIKKERDSQFELLRIVAMFFVVTGHLIVKGADTVGLLTPYSVGKDGVAGVIIYSGVVGGVNLFVMITGWYGVKRVLSGFVRLFVDCLVFGAVSYLFLMVLSPVTAFNVKHMILSMMFTSNWFVVSYMMLLLVTPIIEKSLEGTRTKQQGYWLLYLTVFNLYFGYWLGKVNDNGYNVVQFVWLYYVSRYLRMTTGSKLNQYLCRNGLLVYVIGTLLLALVFIGASYIGHTLDTMRWFSYNNPLLMVSCIGLFAWFSHLTVTSRMINMIATGMFGVFLLHTTPYVIPFRNEVTSAVFDHVGYVGIISESLLIMVGCGIVAVLINKVNKPAVNRVVSVIQSKIHYD